MSRKRRGSGKRSPDQRTAKPNDARRAAANGPDRAGGPTPDDAASAPSAVRPFDARPGTLLAVTGAVAVALGVIPLTHGEGGLLTLWGALGDPAALVGGGALQSPKLLAFALLLAPLGGLAVLTARFSGRLREDAASLIAAAVALPALVALLAANPQFVWTPQHGLWTRYLGFPVLLGAPLAAAGLHAVRLSPGSRTGRLLAALGALLLVSSALTPWWDHRGWSWPVMVALRGLASGQIAVGAAGFLVIALLAGGVATLACLPAAANGPGPNRLAARLSGPTVFLLLVAVPLWLLVLGVDAALSGELPAAPRFWVTIAAAVQSLWLVMGLRRLVVRWDAGDAPGGMTAPGWRTLRRLVTPSIYGLAVFVAFSLFFLLKTHGLRASVTDENIYFYAAEAMTRGVQPYRDYFFAHPPLHIVVPAIPFAVFGFNLTLAKLIPVFATMVTGAFILAIARRHFGRLPAVAALLAFFFANEVLKASTNLTGINLTTMWMTAGLWAALSRRWLTGGVFLALAVCTGFYSIAAALALVVLAAFAGVRPFLRIAGAFFGLAGGINAVFWGLGGDAYIEGVYTYHGRKPQKDLLGRILITIHYHAIPCLAFLLAPLGALVERLLPRQRTTDDADIPAWRLLDPRTLWDGRPEDAARVAWLLTAALVIEFAMFKELHSFYFTLWFPGLAVLVGYVAHVVAGRLVEAAHTLAEPTRWRRPVAVAAAACVGVACWLPLAVSADSTLRERQAERIAQGELKRDRTGFLSEYEKRGDTVQFRWVEPPLLPSLSGVVEALFWRSERTKGAIQPGTAWYLQSKKRYFAEAQAVADYVRENSTPEETLTGASTVAPLIALLAERYLAGQVVDTNTKRFKAETITREEFFESVCADGLRFVIAAPNSFFSPRTPTNHATVRDQFRVGRVFRDKWVKHWRDYPIVVFERKTATPEDGAPVCKYVEGPRKKTRAPRSQRPTSRRR